MKQNNSDKRRSELLEAIQAVRQHFIYAGVFSAAVNILMLSPIIYMLQVYDRVISSGSQSTLLMLTLLLMFLLAAMGGFEWVRTKLLINASNRLERSMRQRVFDATFQRSLLTGGAVSNIQPIGDLTSLRQFLTGQGIIAFFDAPWFPIYIAVMFMFHFWFGVVGILAGIAMVALAWITEKATNDKLQEANNESNWANNYVNSSLRNAEVIEAMGMAGNIRHRQQNRADNSLSLQSQASNAAGALRATSKSFRILVQSLILGLGALLALRGEISPGMMIAGSLLLGRALAPIDMLVSTWKGFSDARAQYHRLKDLLEKLPAQNEGMSLPAPEGRLEADQVVVVPPGSRVPVVRGVSFQLNAGEALGIVGPSASGKSSLARSLLGVWPAANGKVRLDGADIASWNRDELGPYIGYLPQDIELFDGTISENICRFGPQDPEAIVAAARMAGVHDMILHLPQGYDTVISAGGGGLSGGQRQRLGLARAVYGSPRLLVLDEPNSNLDEQGEKELVSALQRVKAQGCTSVLITHRPAILSHMDKVLVMKDGGMMNFGPREEILDNLLAASKARRKAAG